MTDAQEIISQGATHRYRTEIFFEELDQNGHLHNARFPVHVERAVSDFFSHEGISPAGSGNAKSDLVYAVRELHCEFINPVRATGHMLVVLWIQHLGRTSLTTRFVCCDVAENILYACGHRVIVKIDRQTGCIAPWERRVRSAIAHYAPEVI